MSKFLDISIETAAPHETNFVILPLPEAMIATDGSFWLPLDQKDILFLRALHSSFFAFAASPALCRLLAGSGSSGGSDRSQSSSIA